MRIRFFGACVLSAWLAALASAQTTTTLPPLVAPAPYPETPAPAPQPTPPRAGIIIEAVERPAPVQTPPPSKLLPMNPPVVSPQVANPPLIINAPPPAFTDGPHVPIQASVPIQTSGPPPGTPLRFWVDNEWLLWWIQGTKVPPLVTTSPAGIDPTLAGNLGNDAQSVYGPGSQANHLRMGYRLIVGGYLDDDRRFALEASFMMTANGGNQYNASSPGLPIIARPVVSALNGSPLAEPIAVPGVANGSIHIATRTSGIVGAGVWLRENFTRTDDPCDTCHLCRRGGCCGGHDGGSKWYCRFDSLFGYRYLRYSENLEIDDTVNAVVPLNGVPAGSTLQRNDQFHTSNTFHGVDLGMTGEVLSGPWSIGILAKVAIGFNNSSIDVLGTHNLDGVILQGGLLAQPSNSGHFTRTQASAVPELGLKLGYAFTPNMKLYAGYTFMYWYHIARAAGEVNPMIDPTLLTSGAPGANTTNQPRAIFEDRSIWMQGINLGFEWRY